MQAGKLRKRLIIQALQDATTTPNQFNETPPVWNNVAEVWGSLEQLSGRELWLAQQVQPDVTERVTIRYFPSLTSKMRFQLGQRLLNIWSIIDREGRKRTMECLCREVV